MTEIKNIRNLAFNRGVLTESKRGTDPVLPILKRTNSVLNIPYYDDCCIEQDSGLPLPVGYQDGDLVRYNPESKTWVIVPTGGGGGGSSLTITDIDGSVPNVENITVTSGIYVNDDGAGNATLGVIFPEGPTNTSQLLNDGASGVNPFLSAENLIAGTNMSIDITDPQNPVFNAAGGGGGNPWNLTGNAGTVSTDYIGTSDNQALRLKSFNVILAYLQSDGAFNGWNVGFGTAIFPSRTTGDYNFAVGDFTFQALTTGSFNIGIGSGTGPNLTTGAANIAIGAASLGGGTIFPLTGSGNVVIGKSALFNIRGASDENVVIGNNAAYQATTGNYNVVLGSLAGDKMLTGSQNIIIGYRGVTNANSGANELSGTRNIMIGESTHPAVWNGSNQLNIQNLIYGTGLDGVEANISSGNIGIGVKAPSQKLEVAGAIRFSGALMPGNTAGTSGQVLTSAGAGVTPTWTTLSGGGGLQDLQSVTDEGDTTTNQITSTNAVRATNVGSTYGASLQTNNTIGGFLNVQDTAFSISTFSTAGIRNTFNNLLGFPTGPGTFALSVNGNAANGAGDISLTVAREIFQTPKTAAYPLVSGDFATTFSNNIEMNVATTHAVTIDDSTLASVPVGGKVNIFWYGVGQPQFVPGGTAVLLSDTGGDKIAVRYTAVTIVKRSATEFYLIGNVTT